MHVVPLIVTVVGLLLYGLGNAKVAELGRVAFFVGLFWLVGEWHGAVLGAWSK